MADSLVIIKSKECMKRILVLVFVFAFALHGCAGISDTWKQGKASAEIEPYARKAIEIIDDYLAFDLSTEEAMNSFEELEQRIEPYDVCGVDSNYSEPDQAIAYAISDLPFSSGDKRTDIEYRQYRDILAFQIGETVSGKAYEAKRSNLENCPKLVELFHADLLPFDYASEFTSGEWLTLILHFDEMNGVGLSDLQRYIESVYEDFHRSDLKNATIGFSYSRYEQGVFGIFFHITDGVLTGYVSRQDEKAMKLSEEYYEKYTPEEVVAMEGYPKEYAILRPLYEFSSIEQLPEAIEKARFFAK